MNRGTKDQARRKDRRQGAKEDWPSRKGFRKIAGTSYSPRGEPSPEKSASETGPNLWFSVIIRPSSTGRPDTLLPRAVCDT